MLMTALGQTETHVTEIFPVLGRFSRSDTAMDLRTGYDFNKEADRMRAHECLIEEKPLLLCGSPRCEAFSELQNLSKDSERWRTLVREGMQHLTFVCVTCTRNKSTMKNSFCTNTPARVRSWGLWMIREILIMSEAVRRVCD